jgi:exonuclease VII small subunit
MIDFKVNKFKLDTENEEHSNLYKEYAEQLADAKTEKDKAEDRLKFILSEVEIDIRKNPPDDLKITEPTIKSLVNVNKKVIRFREELVEIKEKTYHLEALVSSLEHRKSNLNNLTTLFVTGYYSLPKANKTITDQVRKKVRKNLNKRKDK